MRRISKGVSTIALTVAAVGCSSSSAGNNVACGPGTTLDASVCYVASGHAPDASLADAETTLRDASDAAAAADVTAEAQSPVTFAGVTAVAPASTTALFVSWRPASATGMADAGGVFTYDVYVGTSPGGENFGAPTATSAPGGTSIVIDNGLTANTTYYVVVRAVDSEGHEEGNSVEMSMMTQADTQPPVFAGVTSVTSAAEASLTISWAAATDNLTPTAGILYDVYLSTSAGGENLNVPDAVSAPGALSMTVSGLPLASTTYYVIVRAVDAAGNVDTSPEDTIELSGMSGTDDLPPVFGGCSSAVAVDAQSIAVTWTPATDNSTPQNLIAYDIFASTTEGGQDFNNPTKTLTSSGVSLLTGGLVDGLAPGTTYYLVCRAHDLSNNEDQNTFGRIATTLVDTTPPVFAGASGVRNIAPTSVVLYWNTPATDNQTPQNQIEYLVYQGTTAGAEVSGDAGAAVAVSAPGATSVTVAGLTSGTTYYWIVRAEDRAGNIEQDMTEVSATTLTSFGNNVVPILSNHCAITGCHVPGSPPNGLVMIPSQAYQDLVGVTVVEDSSYVRVDPGDAADSYIYLKITGTQPVGVRMPATGLYLSPTDIATIASWINQGALNN